MKIRTLPFIELLKISMLVTLSGVFFAPLVIDHELHDPTRMGKIFFFARWMLLVIPVGIIALARNWKQPLAKLSLFVLAWLGWILLRGKVGGIWYDEKFFWLAGCFAFFVIASSILQTALNRERSILFYIPAISIVLVAAAEAIIGLLQLYGLHRIYHSLFKVTGTFFNPAPYAGFLVASLPWALLLTNMKQNTISRVCSWLGWTTVFLVLTVIPPTHSRAAYLGLMSTILVWVFSRYKPLLYLKRVLNTRLKKRLAFILAPLILLILVTGLYWFKKDSASGRLLIWEVIINTIKEKPLTGHGFNTLQATLAPAQAAYFAEGRGSDEEKMLAGSVRWAFNEPLQIASEAGLIGLLLFLLVTGHALFYKIPKPVSRERYLAIGTARASLSGVMVFGCFSYPFYSLSVTLLFFYSLAVLAALKSSTDKHQNRIVATGLKAPVLFGLLLLFMFYRVQTPKLKQAYWLWNEAETLYQMGNYQEANNSYAEAYPVLQHQGLFLQQNGKSLFMESKHHGAIIKLTEAGSYFKDEFWYIVLGDCYKATGEFSKAEDHYKLAANIIPHKFYPLYLLAKLYRETGQNKKAIAIAQEVMDKTVKVPSKAIEEIREEMQEILAKNKKSKTISDFKIEEESFPTYGLTLIKYQFW